MAAYECRWNIIAINLKGSRFAPQCAALTKYICKSTVISNNIYMPRGHTKPANEIDEIFNERINILIACNDEDTHNIMLRNSLLVCIPRIDKNNDNSWMRLKIARQPFSLLAS